MAYEALRDAARRSNKPEKELIANRDSRALWIKYHERITGSSSERAAAILLTEHHTAPQIDSTTEYRTRKYLGGMCVESEAPLLVAASDLRTGLRLDASSTVTSLHIDYLNGPQHFRDQLAAAADYISANEELGAVSNVVGTTYREMANLAIRVGFRDMRIEAAAPGMEHRLQAAHMAFCAVNGIVRVFEPTAVYMPTPEFVDRFAS